jgi:DNA-binding NarL/FixJ family response regulator
MTQVDRSAVRNLRSRAESETPIRLVLVEDHAILRDGIRALLELESDVVIVGEFDGIESSLEGIRQSQPDVVVLDLALPNGSGIELLGEIGRLSPRSRKLVLTASNGEEYIRAALGAGADGYVLKDASSAELMLAIRTVSIGQRFLCKAVASKVLLGFLSGDRQPPSPIRASSITVREREVLVRIAQGQIQQSDRT